MARKRTRPALAGLAAVIAAGLVAAGVVLTTERSGDDPAPGSGSTATTATDAAQVPGEVTVTIPREGPDLPGADVLDQCRSSSRQVVARYDTAALGEVVLQCGTSAQGYEHIRVRHSRDWQDVVAGHGSRDWDDAMLTAVQTALGSPRDGYPADAGDGKVCFAAPVRFDDGSRPDDEPFVKVIVSATTDRVITAYPTREDGC
ncbi:MULTISPECIES: hypothetical protein [Curtobacterium]|uniref:hypothetical protein n=1 Tax=Curtobacterium TaxID=2034 RepID=UPI0007374142|nr:MULTISPECIES: hypothetical protein [Curtobacterium]KTR19479.1 hypothetical protein NS330_07990 [Curtobacterium citreum]